MDITLRWLLAALHLIALGIGVAAVFARGQALQHLSSEKGYKRIFLADNLWGISALLWITTGLLRAFGGIEKGSAYYLNNTFFWIKMGLFLTIFLLEIRPMINLIQWRIRVLKDKPIDPSSAKSFALISYVQAGLTLLMVLAATAMARGIDF
jgi:putative membrane protein